MSWKSTLVDAAKSGASYVRQYAAQSIVMRGVGFATCILGVMVLVADGVEQVLISILIFGIGVTIFFKG